MYADLLLAAMAVAFSATAAETARWLVGSGCGRNWAFVHASASYDASCTNSSDASASAWSHRAFFAGAMLIPSGG